MHMTSSKKKKGQELVPWIERMGTMHLAFFMTCKKGGAAQRNVIITELRGFESRKRIIYCAKRT